MEQLREKNHELTEDHNTKFLTTEEDRQEIIFLRCNSYTLDRENIHLQSELRRYQQIAQQLQAENITLQKQNKNSSWKN